MSRRVVAHVITGLSTGGAEMMLYKLATTLDPEQFESVVISLMDKGTIGPRLEAKNVPVFTINMSRGAVGPGYLFRLRRLLRRLNPDLVQGWMYHGNLAATLGCWGTRSRVPVLWNIRQTLYALKDERLTTRWVVRAGAALSPAPECIIYNSRTSAEQHERIGYEKSARRLVPNGFDTVRFRPDAGRRAALRAELGIAEDVFLIGMVARYHPVKDHANFLRAAALLRRGGRDVRFLLAGQGVDWANAELADLVRALGLQDSVFMLGERADVASLNPGLDLACLASSGDAFPNAIGEAMACGVPCVVTDVGDCARIVGDTGLTVPPRDPAALAAAWNRFALMTQEERRKRGQGARQRVRSLFALESVTHQYEALYKTYCGIR